MQFYYRDFEVPMSPNYPPKSTKNFIAMSHVQFSIQTKISVKTAQTFARPHKVFFACCVGACLLYCPRPRRCLLAMLRGVPSSLVGSSRDARCTSARRKKAWRLVRALRAAGSTSSGKSWGRVDTRVQILSCARVGRMSSKWWAATASMRPMRR